MPEVWAQVPEMNPGDLFPKVQNNPIRLTKLFPKVTKIRSYGASYRIKWLDSNRSHPTLQSDANQKPTRWLVDNEEYRPTTNDLKTISSFPVSFQFDGDENSDWGLIGNSVPPLFMFAIAGTIREQLFGNYTMPDQKGNEYLDILEAAWQEHLKPREPDAPTVISLFAGCGGSSLGYSMAGFRELLAVEWDDNAVATFNLNFPDIPVYHGDIHNLSVDECLELVGLEPGQLDILEGSPPCQGFSTAGKRQMTDPRNQLYNEYVRLLRGLKPKVLIMENVSGLVKGKMKLIFADIMRELKASGYKVSCRLMNTMYFNVPQSRQRLIWIGVREDLEIEPGHPRGINTPPTVRDALSGIEALNGPLPVSGSKTAECCQKMKQGQTASDFYKKNWGFNLFRLAWNKPSPTFTKRGGACGLIHPELPRKCIKEEYQAVMSYPRQFKLFGNNEDARARLGNSVPPLFMKSIAEHVRTEIFSPSLIAAAVAEHRMT